MSTENENGVVNAGKRFKNSIVEKLKKDVENLKYSTNYSQSNLFRLQLVELLNEVTLTEKKRKRIDKSVDLLISSLKSLDEKKNLKSNDLSLFNDEGIVVPLGDLCQNMEGVYTFKPPTDVRVIGSYATNTYLQTASAVVSVDVNLQMPKDYFTERDFLNFRYFIKRNIYMCHVYQQLINSNSKFSSNIKYEFISCYSSPYKPVLVMYFEDGHFEIRLHFSPDTESFKLYRFNPNQSNIRTKWFYEKFAVQDLAAANNLETEYATPNYNYEILKDLRAVENNELLKTNLNSAGITEAVKLLKIWLHKRDLNNGHGSFDSFTICMLMVNLLNQNVISGVMSQYQIFQIVLLQLSEARWDVTGISIKAKKVNSSEEISVEGRKMESGEFKFEDYHNHFDVVFADHSGYLNICAKMSRSTFLRVKKEAALSISLLDNERLNIFDELFTKSHSIEMSFDALVRIDPLNDSSYYNKIIKEKTSCHYQVIDRYKKADIITLKPLQTALLKALDNRVSQLFIQPFPNLKWSTNISAPDTCINPIVIGLVFTDSYESTLIKGPISDTPDAKDFRNFWGTKSELRRFHDTTIREAVYFETANISEKRLIYAQIVKHICQSHFSIEQANLKFIDRQMNSLLSLPEGIVENYGTGEEKIADALNTYNEFMNLLRNLPDLPLAINNINGISSVFRFTEVFAPLPCCFNYDEKAEKNMIFKSKDKCFPKYPLGSVVVPYVRPLEVACQLESSGKWPEDIQCIKHLKSAFYLKIVEKMRTVLNLTAFANRDHCHVLYKGFVFRIFIFTMSELFLLKMSKNEQGVLLTNETSESIAYEKQMTLIPKLNSFLHSVQQKFSSFSGVCRLVKRWMAAHFLIEYMEEEAVDLICAYFFVNPHSYEPPKSIITAFIRFLEFISTFDWKNQIMALDFNNDLKESDLVEVNAHFKENRTKLQPIFIVTPFDKDKKTSVWTKNKPNMQQLCRIVIIARQSLHSLKKSILNFESTESFKKIFRPNLEIFDLVIHLKSQYCVKAFQKVDIVKGTFLPHYHDHTPNEKNKEIPVFDFDPVQIYLKELRSAYGELAYFCSDLYGDTKIYVLWKPDELKSKDIATKKFKFRSIDTMKSMLEVNFTAIIDDFKTLGNELVESVEVKNQNSIFR